MVAGRNILSQALEQKLMSANAELLAKRSTNQKLLKSLVKAKLALKCSQQEVADLKLANNSLSNKLKKLEASIKKEELFKNASVKVIKDD